MSRSFSFYAKVHEQDDGQVLFTFPDFGGVISEDSLEKVLLRGEGYLEMHLKSFLRAKLTIPDPIYKPEEDKNNPEVAKLLFTPPLQILLKAHLYVAFRNLTDTSQRQLARELEVNETSVRRMLDPDHGTKIATIEAGLKHMGLQISVTLHTKQEGGSS